MAMALANSLMDAFTEEIGVMTRCKAMELYSVPLVK